MTGGRAARGRRTDLGPAAVALAAATLAAIGWRTGSAVPTAAATLAGVVAGASVPFVASRRLSRRTLGSCALVGAAVLAAGAPTSAGAGDRAGVAAAGLATVVAASTTYALAPDADDDGDGHLSSVARTVVDSTVGALVVAVALSAVTAAAAVASPALVALAGGLGAATATPFAGFVSSAVLTVVAVVLAALAGPTLEPILPESVTIPRPGTLVDRVTGLPKAAYYALGLAVLAPFWPVTAVAFDAALAALGPVGAAVALALTSGVLHLLVGGVAACCVAALLGRAAALFCTVWLEPYPLRTLAFASGGLVVTVVAAALARVLGYDAAYGYWGVVGVLVVALVPVRLSAEVDGVGRPRTWRRRYLDVGVAGLLIAAFVGAERGAEPVVVFGGVAAAILVRDVGATVHSLREGVGDRVDTRQVELVHATGSAVAGLAGVGLAAGATYGLGAVAPPGERWQAVVPVALALVALVAFALPVVAGDGYLSRRRAADLARAAVTHRFRIPAALVLLGAVLLPFPELQPFGGVAFVMALIAGVPAAILDVADDGESTDRPA